jgi:hypothetical protein
VGLEDGDCKIWRKKELEGQGHSYSKSTFGKEKKNKGKIDKD